MAEKNIKDEVQNINQWDNWWNDISPIQEIQMWDYYGGRQWVTKYCPRYGKVIEAGCGTGRYVFYLRRLGIDIEGLDFSEKLINKLNNLKKTIDRDAFFIKGDVTKLPFEDNSLSGYISLGVVEHFIEGPQKAIAEAYRVLRPGGVAIITTPNKSWFVRITKLKVAIKNFIKKILLLKNSISHFFQYEYTPTQLKGFIEKQGFYVSRAEACDLLYTFNEAGNFTGNNLKPGKFAYWFANTFESTCLKRLGAQTITISIKKAPLMYCFLSGKLTATPDSLEKYDVPISKEMQNSPLAELFAKGRKVTYASSYIINPPVQKPIKKKCYITGREYISNELFEDFGFNVPVAPDQLKIPEINIRLSVENIQPVWRKRK